MSNPITAGIMIGATVLGGAASAAGSVKAGNAQYQQQMYQAQISERNKKLSEMNAIEAEAAGKINSQNALREARQLAGRQRATLAALGMDVNEGSAGLILQDTAALGADEATRIRREAMREALGFRIQGDQLGSDAVLQRSGAKSSRSAGLMSAGGTLLSTAGSAAYMKFKT